MKELTRRDWLKGTSSFAAASIAYATTAQAQSLTMKGYVPTAKNPIRMSSNENPYGIPRSAQNAMIDGFKKSHLYGSGATRELLKIVADRNGVASENVLVASGSKEVLKVAALIVALEGGKVMAANPTYHDLVRYSGWVGTDITWVPLDKKSMTTDLDAMRAAYTDDVKLIYLCNPNNPVPTILEKGKLQDFCLEMSKKCIVFIDEAYHEFVTDPNYESMVKIAATNDNIIVSRTASKIHGFAGIRLGFAFSTPTTLAKINRRVTGSVSTPAIYGALAAYKDHEFMDFIKRKNEESLQEVYKVFEKHNVRHFKSNANFTFFETGIEFSEVRDRFLRNGINIGRPFPPFITWARVSMAKPEDMTYFAEVYEKEFVS